MRAILRLNYRNSKTGVVLSLLMAGVFLTLALNGPTMAAQTMKFTPDQVLVSFHPGTPGHAIASAHAGVSGKVQKSIERLGIHVVRVPNGKALAAVVMYQKIQTSFTPSQIIFVP